MNDTISTNQRFTVTARVENIGEAEVDDTGLLRLTLPAGFGRVDPGNEPLMRPLVIDQDISWILSAPSAPSEDVIVVEINRRPFDVNEGDSASAADGADNIAVVTEQAAGIESCVLAVTEPPGALDGVLSTEQVFTIEANITPSANSDDVWIELINPPGFEIDGDSLRFLGRGDGSSRMVSWNVTAPSGAMGSALFSMDAEGVDVNSASVFDESCQSTVSLDIVQKASLSLFAEITGPPAAIDGEIPLGLSFRVEATVTKHGDAGIAASDPRLSIEMPDGWDPPTETTKIFTPGTPVVWDLVAPSSPAVSLGSIVISFADPYAIDENSNLPAALENDSTRIEVITETGEVLMENRSAMAAIPPKVVPQGAEDVPMLRMVFTNNLDQQIGLDTLFVSVKNQHGQLLGNAASAVSSIRFESNGYVYTESPGMPNPVPMIIDHGFTIGAGSNDTVLLAIDIAAGAPSGGLHIDIAQSRDVVFTIGSVSGGTGVGVVFEETGEDITGHFMSAPMQIMSARFEEYAHNYPNPFRAGEESTKISYFLTSDSSVTIDIYALTGELVWTKSIGSGQPGGTGTEGGTWHEVEWNGRNDKGELVRNGVYLCKINAGSQSAVFKIAVAK
jgi:hypothetical protein